MTDDSVNIDVILIITPHSHERWDVIVSVCQRLLLVGYLTVKSSVWRSLSSEEVP